ncbi:malonyl-ACP O-methyltransferase BioC [Anaerosinus sp.]
MLNKNIITKHFSKAAKEYDEYAKVQKKMALVLNDLLEEKSNYEILEIGCGTGYLTKILADKFPDANILATDISPDMLESAKYKLSNYQNITYAILDGEKISTDKKYDLIISNAVFQWFSDYNQTFQRFFECLNPNGYLIYSTFGPKTFIELSQSFTYAYQKNQIKQNYIIGPSFSKMNELINISTSIGFISTHQEKFYTEYFPSPKDFLRSIKKIGANNSSQADHVLVNKKVMTDMLTYYEDTFSKDDQVYTTYHAIYGKNQKV